MRKFLTVFLLSIGAIAQTGQVNHGGTGLNAASNNSILVGTGPNTYILVNVPDCGDTNGNHLNYNPNTYTFSCGTSSGIQSGTPYQITRYDTTGHLIQDSSGNDNPTNGPTRWVNGLSVVNGAGYRQFVNSSSGTAANLLVCTDPTATSVQQVTTCPSGSTSAFGIADNGAGTTGNVQVAMIGFHSCVFDGTTSINDYFGPSPTQPGQCTDLGASKPNGVQVLGHVTTVNSGAGTTATVDLFTGDTVAPGGGGGSGTVANSGCANANAYYASAGTTVSADCNFTDDGAGNPTAKSLGLTDPTYAGFMWMKQGPLPPAAPANTILRFPPTSVPNAYSFQDSSTPGAAGDCWKVGGTTTDTNGHTIDQMSFGACGGGGGGTVSSVGQTVNGSSSSGIFAVTGSPVTASGTLNINTSGTSGGLPYFSSASVISSSGVLTNHGVVIGQGAGSAPVSTGAGSAGQVLTSNGPSADPTFQAASSGGAPCPDGLAGICAYYPNDAVTGTATNIPVVFKDYTINQPTVIKTTSAEFQKGWATGVVGICVAGCGTTGDATVKISGQVACTFESGNTPTKNNFVEIGSTGKCLDNGGAGVNENPETHLFFAKADVTGSSGSTTVIDLLPGGMAFVNQTGGNAPGLSPAPACVAVMTPGSPYFSPGVDCLDTHLIAGGGTTSAPVTSALPAIATIGVHRFYVGTSGGYFDVYGDQGTTSTPRLTINTAGYESGFGGSSLRVACIGTQCLNAISSSASSSNHNASIYSDPDVESAITGSITYGDNGADVFVWTVTGNATITANAASINAGHKVRFVFIQDGSGGHAVTLPSGWAGVGVAQPPPTVTTTANAVTIIDCVWATTTQAYCR